MGAHSSKEKLSRSYSERYIHTQVIERERFGSFGKRASKGFTKGEFGARVQVQVNANDASCNSLSSHYKEGINSAELQSY